MTETKTTGVLRSLPFRLLVLTIAFVMLAEVLIFAPSIGRYRLNWLEMRLADAHLAALALEAAPDGMVAAELTQQLLAHTYAVAIDVTLPQQIRTHMLSGPETPAPAVEFDLADASVIDLLADAFSVLFTTGDRLIRVVGPSPKNPLVWVEVTLREAPLRAEMLAFSKRILALSIIISLIAAGLVYLSLHWLLVRPVRRMISSIMAFRSDPENPTAIAPPTTRRDEIGLAQSELAEMQIALRTALRQQQRLAALGTAVAKIHHDLGNVLSTSSLMSERIARSDDPEVRKLASRLLTSIDRAVDLSAQTLAYSRDGVLPVQRGDVALAALSSEVGEELVSWSARDPNRPPLVWTTDIQSDMRIKADEDQLRRALSNLGRNAVQAGADRLVIATVLVPDAITITVSDNGPGLPPRAIENLFQPFAGSARAGGTGLGLVIVREVMRAHGGDVTLVKSDSEGSVFALRFPHTRGDGHPIT